MENFKISFKKFFSNRKKLQPFKSKEERAKCISVMYKDFLNKSILDVGCSDKALKKWILPDVKYILE